MAYPNTPVGNQFPNPGFISNIDLHNFIDENFDALQAALFSAYSSYIPTLGQPSSISKTVTYAKYTQLGKTVMGNVSMHVLAAGTGTNGITSSLPVAPAYTSTDAFAVGTFALIKATGPRQAGTVLTTGTTALAFQEAEQTNVIGLAPSTALAIGDVLTFEFRYEVP